MYFQSDISKGWSDMEAQLGLILGQEWQMSFPKGKVVNILGFMDLMVSTTITIQFFHFSIKVVMDNMQMSGCLYLF